MVPQMNNEGRYLRSESTQARFLHKRGARRQLDSNEAFIIDIVPAYKIGMD
jgi:hypothetical protein